MFSYRSSVSILLFVFSVLELTICEKNPGEISEPERIFGNSVSNGTKENQIFQRIFPGTRWCGDGNKARHAKELGSFKETDACCREHDQCTDAISAGESKHGLTNKGSFTRSDCSCDEKLYKCLSSLCSSVAASIGITYFDVLRPSCFTYDHPITCAKEESNTIFGKRCIKEEADTTKPKTWHWRAAKKFDISDTSAHLAKCFKNVTRDKMKSTKESIWKFIRKY